MYTEPTIYSTGREVELSFETHTDSYKWKSHRQNKDIMKRFNMISGA